MNRFRFSIVFLFSDWIVKMCYLLIFISLKFNRFVWVCLLWNHSIWTRYIWFGLPLKNELQQQKTGCCTSITGTVHRSVSDGVLKATQHFIEKKVENFPENVLPISGAKRHEFPMSGSPFGPGTSEYGRICAFFVDSFSAIISGVAEAGTSFGKMLIADENAVRFTSELVAVRVPILNALVHDLASNQRIHKKRERKLRNRNE